MDGNSENGFTEEARVLARARDGDEQAFSALYENHARALYSLALRLTTSPATAEDVVQETFVKALRSDAVFRGDASLRSWLKRLASNASIDRLRLDTRQASLRPEPADGAIGEPEPHAECLGLLAKMDPIVRAVVWLHTMEGHSHAEIGARFGFTESWSKTTLSRGLSRLRDEIGEAQHE